MPYKVLIVDDSSFFQTRLKSVINEHPELNVVGVAANGQEAVEKAAELSPDIISMDYEMPLLDGISAVRKIMEHKPTPILMFSSMTYEGARITLDALEAGAVDYMNKNFAEVSANSAVFKRKFHEKLISYARDSNIRVAAPAARAARLKPTPAPATNRSSPSREAIKPASPRRAAGRTSLKGRVKLVAIGASTGGPVAVSDIINALPANFPAPIIIVQHMPTNFTRAFAERLNRTSQLRVKEAETGDRLARGHVLVAPGGLQTMIDRQGQSVKVFEGDDRVNYRPCVDITFASAAAALGRSVLGIVLTGMGSDGCDGSRLLKSNGSVIWSQSQDTCVVFGMPAAVERGNISSEVLPVHEIADRMVADL